MLNIETPLIRHCVKCGVMFRQGAPTYYMDSGPLCENCCFEDVKASEMCIGFIELRTKVCFPGFVRAMKSTKNPTVPVRINDEITIDCTVLSADTQPGESAFAKKPTKQDEYRYVLSMQKVWIDDKNGN